MSEDSLKYHIGDEVWFVYVVGNNQWYEAAPKDLVKHGWVTNLHQIGSSSLLTSGVYVDIRTRGPNYNNVDADDVFDTKEKALRFAAAGCIGGLDDKIKEQETDIQYEQQVLKRYVRKRDKLYKQLREE